MDSPAIIIRATVTMDNAQQKGNTARCCGDQVLVSLGDAFYAFTKTLP